MKNFISFFFTGMALLMLAACEKDKVTEKDLDSDLIPLIPKVNPCERLSVNMNIDSILKIGIPNPFLSYVSYEVCECDTIDVITTQLPLHHIVVWAPYNGSIDTLTPPLGISDQYRSLFEVHDTSLQSLSYFGELILDFDTCP